jgi:hypothetical protein
MKIFDFQNKKIILQDSNKKMDFLVMGFPARMIPPEQNSGYSFGNIEKSQGYLNTLELSKFLKYCYTGEAFDDA